MPGSKASVMPSSAHLVSERLDDALYPDYGVVYRVHLWT